MNRDKALILISNDDGVSARGIAHLVDIAREFGDVVVVAPDSAQSGKSSAITVETPLRVKQLPAAVGVTIYAVNGTPVDCVKIAMHTLLERKPDLVLSGINHGSNSGNSMIYSGTMGVAFEGAINAIPSIGFSLTNHSPNADFSGTTEIIREIISKVMDKGISEGYCLNVNIPETKQLNGYKVVRAARGRWIEEYQKGTDPHGRDYYWLTGSYMDLEPNSDETDHYWLARDYATIVPCKVDQSAAELIEEVTAIFK
ncbi:MAG: 5'/3'-nucleotidase SurE [Bacteroidales bacterium]